MPAPPVDKVHRRELAYATPYQHQLKMGQDTKTLYTTTMMIKDGFDREVRASRSYADRAFMGAPPRMLLVPPRMASGDM